MKSKNAENQPDLFSDDPEENLRIENDILHLKIKAELGGEMTGTGPLPPDLENKFLKNILEFEHAFANNKQVKIFDFLGKPYIRKSAELDEEEIEGALNDLCKLLGSKNIELDFSGDYDARLKYRFITEELFEHETDDIEIPGLITHFIYEEFHPNHYSDIESRVIGFIDGWIDQQLNEDSWELSDSFILPDGTEILKKEFLAKANNVFASYKGFSNPSYSFDKILFELKEEAGTGVGHVTGFITYDAILESGDEVRFQGPFEMRLGMEHKWWSIFYFVLPGFEW